ncbi:hypothetical protein V8D89_009427 [Ganoderma adspersum]
MSLDIHSFSPSVPDPRICTLQLPDLLPGESPGLCHLVASQVSQTHEGHFRADPEPRMIALTYHIRGPADSIHTSILLIPCAILHTQAHAAMSMQAVSARSDAGGPSPVRVVPWKDWGPSACLHLRVPVRPEESVSRSTILIPHGSRMPLVISYSANPNHASIYVVDINPLAARYARSVLRGTAAQGVDESPGETAIVAPEDMERVLPGVVEPECSAIPYAVYRFELPDSPTEWPNGHTIRRVQMNMTGFTVTFDGVEFEEIWAI